MTDALVDRRPQPSIERLLADLVPPPRFADARVDTYIPDDRFPSQREAAERIAQFGNALTAGAQPERGGFFSLFAKKSAPQPSTGLYLDGGFGVGKTHLLTSLYHLAPGHRVYGTFVEYTHLVGALGFPKALEVLSEASVVCIDEFELDDPGDTLLMTRLLRELSDRGVAIVATSNTLPEALGEGRFAAQDFLREIQSMADRFEVLRVDGEDYRHREGATIPEAIDDRRLIDRAQTTPGATLDDFGDLLRHLAQVHPSRYGALIDDVTSVHLRNLATVDNHNDALRLVVLIDRLYDREIPVLASGIKADELYTEELLSSGYRKKYLRSLSRLGSLVRDGVALLQGTPLSPEHESQTPASQP